MFNEKKLLHGFLVGRAMHKPQLNNREYALTNFSVHLGWAMQVIIHRQGDYR